MDLDNQQVPDHSIDLTLKFITTIDHPNRHHIKSIMFVPIAIRFTITLSNPTLKSIKGSNPDQWFIKATKCYKRGDNCTDTEGIALNQLAKLHQKLDTWWRSCTLFRERFRGVECWKLEGPNMFEVCFFLQHISKLRKKFEEAEVYCTRLLDYSGPERFFAPTFYLHC